MNRPASPSPPERRDTDQLPVAEPTYAGSVPVAEPTYAGSVPVAEPTYAGSVLRRFGFTGEPAPAPSNYPVGDGTLVLPGEVRARIDAWVRAGHPEETCGLLVGRREGRRTSVVRAVQARNLAREHRGDRFDLDPVAYVMADRAARAEGLAIVGVWHSHPDHPPVPSEADRRAAWAHHSYLIAEVDEEGVRASASYRLEGGRFVREQVLAE